MERGSDREGERGEEREGGIEREVEREREIRLGEGERRKGGGRLVIVWPILFRFLLTIWTLVVSMASCELGNRVKCEMFAHCLCLQ